MYTTFVLRVVFVKLHSDGEEKNFRSMQWLVLHFQLWVWHLLLLFSYCAQNCFSFLVFSHLA